jgi:hypothetical protein
MNVYQAVEKSGRTSNNSREATETFNRLDDQVRAVFAEIQDWEGWRSIMDPDTPNAIVMAFVREMYRSICWYQPHTTEAAFHMIGRFPKIEVELMRMLATHKAEEAEHGLWARDDLAKFGATESGPASPASFAVGAVWWRMAAHEDPLGYIGAEYLYEQLTAIATRESLPIIKARNLPSSELRFVIEHATEDAKHATFLKHIILDVATRYPERIPAMFRCLSYFRAVWPMPVWKEVLARVRREHG